MPTSTRLESKRRQELEWHSVRGGAHKKHAILHETHTEFVPGPTQKKKPSRKLIISAMASGFGAPGCRVVNPDDDIEIGEGLTLVVETVPDAERTDCSGMHHGEEEEEEEESCEDDPNTHDME